MGSEAGLRGTLKRKMKGALHYVRIENTCGSGTPDVNFAWKSVKNDCFLPIKDKKELLFDKNRSKNAIDSCILSNKHVKSYSCWMELKYLKAFPKRKTTKVTLSCFTKEQITWLLMRNAVKKGGSWLFVQVGAEYYLFNALCAAKVYYGVNTNEFKDLAQWIGKKGWMGRDLLSAIEISL